MLENECNSAFRECIKSIAWKNKMQTETERLHTISRRLGSRQILWLLYDFLRPHVTSDSTFKIIDLVKVSLDQFRYTVSNRRGSRHSAINGFMSSQAPLSIDRPEDQMLCAHLIPLICAGS